MAGKTRHRALLAAVAVCVVGIPILLAFLIFVGPTVLFWVNGRLKPVEREAAISRDVRYRVTVTTVLAILVNEILDPSIRVDATMTEIGTGKTSTRSNFPLEDSDFGVPKIQWTANDVATVINLDRAHGLALTLDAKRWRPNSTTSR